MGRGGGGLRAGLVVVVVVVVGLLRMKAGKGDGGPWRGGGGWRGWRRTTYARITILSAESRDCQRCTLFKPRVNRPQYGFACWANFQKFSFLISHFSVGYCRRRNVRLLRTYILCRLYRCYVQRTYNICGFSLEVFLLLGTHIYQEFLLLRTHIYQVFLLLRTHIYQVFFLLRTHIYQVFLLLITHIYQVFLQLRTHIYICIFVYI